MGLTRPEEGWDHEAFLGRLIGALPAKSIAAR
jgi:hypothetical protein